MSHTTQNGRVPPIVSIVGRSDSGKTTLLERLIPELRGRGYRVGTIKHHAHPGFEVDKPGKDTWRHAQAGAEAVALVAPGKMFLLRRTEGELDLGAVAAMMGEVDIVLTEGYRWADTPKVEVVRAARSREPLCTSEELVALVTDLPLEMGVPRFDLEEVEGLADLLERRFLQSQEEG